MLDWYINKNRNVVRETLRKIKDDERSAYDDNVTRVISFFNREDDMDILRRAMLKRFGTKIVREMSKSPRPDGTHVMKSGPEHYVISEVSDALALGHVELANTGFGPKVVTSLATMFTEDDRYYQYVDSAAVLEPGKKSEHIDEIGQIMSEVRDNGSFELTATETDRAACMVESAFHHMFLRGDQIEYDTVLPNAITIKYGSKIEVETEDGKTESIPVDYRRIEDASAIIIEICADKGDYDSSPDTRAYLAYVGACTDFPEGRYLTYNARKPWTIPDLGSKDITYEHMVGSQECNPLTWMRHHGDEHQKACVTTEYPIVLWRGGHRMVTKDRVPITTSFFEQCLELEIGWSRILRAALNGARGRDLWELAATNVDLPKCLDAPVVKEGDKHHQIGWPASHSKDAAFVLSQLTEQIAGGFFVPGYQVIGQLSGMNPSSGVALAIQTAPLIKFRNMRRTMNSDAMRRIFDIERSYLVMRHPEARVIKPTIRQEWDPGTWKTPATDLEEVQALTAELDGKLTDLVSAVRRRRRLSTDNDAIELIERWVERDPEYDWGGGQQDKQPFVVGKKKDDEDDNKEEDNDDGKSKPIRE